MNYHQQQQQWAYQQPPQYAPQASQPQQRPPPQYQAQGASISQYQHNNQQRQQQPPQQPQQYQSAASFGQAAGSQYQQHSGYSNPNYSNPPPGQHPPPQQPPPPSSYSQPAYGQQTSFYAQNASAGSRSYSATVQGGGAVYSQQQSQQQPQQHSSYSQSGGATTNYAAASSGNYSAHHPQGQTHTTTGGYNRPPPQHHQAGTAYAGGGGGGGSSAGAAAASPSEWPPALKKYVEENFKSAKSDSERRVAEGALRDMIQTAIKDGSLWTSDWASKPPLVLSPPMQPQQQRQQQPQQQYYNNNYSSGGRAKEEEDEARNTAKRSRWGNSESSPSVADRHYSNLSMWQGSSGGGGGGAAGGSGSHDDFYSSGASNKSRAKKRKKGQGGHSAVDSREQGRRDQRMKRFQQSRRATSSANTEDRDMEWAHVTVKGTCQEVEKSYFRLTSAPHPSTVRPEPVLRQALQRLKQRWKKREINYEYACNQLKAIRQDLTVQHIKSVFTVDVYETHARISLEQGDITEMNQCQTQLTELYAAGLKGAHIEFTAYGLFYQVYINAKYGQSATELNLMLADLSVEMRKEPVVAHAIQVLLAAQADNYHVFFKLYDVCPNMGGYLMDLLVDLMRHVGLRQITKAFRPSVPLPFLRDELAFLDSAEAIEYLSEKGAVVFNGKGGEVGDMNETFDDLVLDTKASHGCFSRQFTFAVMDGDSVATKSSVKSS